MVGSIARSTHSFQTFPNLLENDLWKKLSHDSQMHDPFIQESIKGKKHYEQDILEQILDEAYLRSIPDLIDTILFHSPIQPSKNVFAIISSKGSKDQLKAFWKHVTFGILQEKHRKALIQFLTVIPSFNSLQETVNLMIECGADMRQIVLDGAKHTLIHEAQYLVIAEYYLKFLNEADKKAEDLQKFSLSWELLNQL
jgi:hypothetical protein